FADGLYAEGGAMQVFDSQLRVQRYIQQFGLEIDPIRPAPGVSVRHIMGKRIESKPGERIVWPFELNAAEKEIDGRMFWQKYVAPAGQEVMNAESRARTLRSREKYDRETFSAFLRAQGASPAAMAILAIGLPSGLGDGPDPASCVGLLREC